MATHDYIISNASGAAVRADLNNALAAIVSNNSNATSPATTYAYQWWADTSTGQLKLRNSANSAWITIFELDGTMLMEDGTVSAPGLAFASDTNTGFFRSAADKINFATGGAERLEIGSSEVVFNDPSNDVDFRVESNGNSHMLFVDAGNDRVGIGASAPDSTLHVHTGTAGSVTANGNANDLVVENSGAGGISILTPDANHGYLIFGSPTSNEGAILRYRDSDNIFAIGTEDTNGILQFRTGAGSEAARIDSTGRVGIGTSAPLSELHVEKATQAHITVKTASSNMAKFGSKGNDVYIGGTSGSANIIFKSNITSVDHPADSGTERLRILSSGGITFNGDTAQANALDDYEEGTFTPTIQTTSTSGQQNMTGGFYTKIGRTVVAHATYSFPTSFSLADLTIRNLPFTSNSTGSGAGALFEWQDGAGFSSGVGRISINTAKAERFGVIASPGGSHTGNIFFTFTYTT